MPAACPLRHVFLPFLKACPCRAKEACPTPRNTTVEALFKQSVATSALANQKYERWSARILYPSRTFLHPHICVYTGSRQPLATESAKHHASRSPVNSGRVIVLRGACSFLTCLLACLPACLLACLPAGLLALAARLTPPLEKIGPTTWCLS